jgi:hypothetical protein
VSCIATEFVLVVFRINEHLGAIRNEGGFHNQSSDRMIVIAGVAVSLAFRSAASR